VKGGGWARGVIDFAVIQDNFCSFSSQGIVGSNYLLICMVFEMYKNSLLRDCDLLNIFSFKCEKIYMKPFIIQSVCVAMWF
jgi:hypothetical protein